MFDFISSVPFEVNRGQRSPYNKKGWNLPFCFLFHPGSV